MRQPTTRIDEFLAKLVRATGRPAICRGDSWQALCPAHDDRTPSLSFRVSDSDHILVKCHAGCTAEAVTKALGMRVSDLMPPRRVDQRMPNNHTNRHPTSESRQPANPCPTGTQCASTTRIYKTYSHAWAAVTRRRREPDQWWTYHDRSGELVGLVLRWNLTGGGKDIRPLARVEAGWIIGAMPSPRVLYRLNDVLFGPNVLSRVYVVEGEKAADAGSSIGLVTVTSAGGASAAHLTDWSPLAGRDVVLLPDNDAVGRKYAATVVAQLLRLTPLPTIRQVRLPKLPEGGDLADFVAASKDNQGGDIVAQIESLCERTATVGCVESARHTIARADSNSDRCVSQSSTHPTPLNQEIAMHTHSQSQLPAEIADASPVVTRLDNCNSSPIRWLWPGRVPAGKLTLLVGDPGLGKSFVTLDIAARVSRGQSLPHLSNEHPASDCTTPGSIVLISAEDDVKDTIRPRLVAAGADLARITALEAVRSPDPERGQPREPDLFTRQRPGRVRAADFLIRPMPTRGDRSNYGLLGCRRLAQQRGDALAVGTAFRVGFAYGCGGTRHQSSQQDIAGPGNLSLDGQPGLRGHRAERPRRTARPARPRVLRACVA